MNRDIIGFVEEAQMNLEMLRDQSPLTRPCSSPKVFLYISFLQLVADYKSSYNSRPVHKSRSRSYVTKARALIRTAISRGGRRNMKGTKGPKHMICPLVSPGGPLTHIVPLYRPRENHPSLPRQLISHLTPPRRGRYATMLIYWPPNPFTEGARRVTGRTNDNLVLPWFCLTLRGGLLKKMVGSWLNHICILFLKGDFWSRPHLPVRWAIILNTTFAAKWKTINNSNS